MNIADKSRLYAEPRRVLRPGGPARTLGCAGGTGAAAETMRAFFAAPPNPVGLHVLRPATSWPRRRTSSPMPSRTASALSSGSDHSVTKRRIKSRQPRQPAVQISISRPARRMASRVARAYQDQIRRDNEAILRHQFAALDYGLVPTTTSVFGGGPPITSAPSRTDPLEALWRLPARPAPAPSSA